MIFPDEPNLRHVAKALWGKGTSNKASIIVGAGFSKNALSLSLAQDKIGFPSWVELTNSMVGELYGHEKPEKLDALKQAKSNGVSKALRIAAEYEAARGRGHLDNLLKSAIPDLAFEPSQVHKQLCELPWTDILTTNYDTLLERAARAQLERRYDVVLSQFDVPTTAQPRIIKLHGTFPDSKQPFIITEDDFRTYEFDYPVMVNLAQQCLVETTCCLIGFSGDDPNFLRWSGWVRDVLGTSHMEPVYLVGLMDNSPSEKALLEKRHIKTIDLSPLFPSEDWPDQGERHEVATKWFLDALSALEPENLRNWPLSVPRDSRGEQKLEGKEVSLPDKILPQLKVEFRHPNHIKFPDEEGVAVDQENYDSLSDAKKVEISVANLAEIKSRNVGKLIFRRIEHIVDIWEQNRSLFTGWLTLPWANAKNLNSYTEGWVLPIASEILEPRNSNAAFRWLEQLSWRLEKCHRPWPLELIESAVALLKLSTARFGPTSDCKHGQLKKHEITIALQLLRALREKGNIEYFKMLEKALCNVKGLRQEDQSFLNLHRIIHCLEHWDIKQATEMLLAWDTTNGDPIWAARRAAILAEFSVEATKPVAEMALAKVQSNPNALDAELRSRETHIVWLNMILSDWQSPQRADLQRRRETLRVGPYDPYNFEDRLFEAISIPPNNLINLAEYIKTTKTEQSSIHRAYIVRRYIEETASILRGDGFYAASQHLENAVPWMAMSDPSEALRLSFRNRSSGASSWKLPEHCLGNVRSETINVGVINIVHTLNFLCEPRNVKTHFGLDNEELSPWDIINEKCQNSLIRAGLFHARKLVNLIEEEALESLIDVGLKLRKRGTKLKWQTLTAIEEALQDFLGMASIETIRNVSVRLVEQPLGGVDGFPLNFIQRVRDPIVSASYRSLNSINVTSAINAKLPEPIFERLLRSLNVEPSEKIRWTCALRLSFAASHDLLSHEQNEKFDTSLKVLCTTIFQSDGSFVDHDAFYLADLSVLPQIYERSNKKLIVETIARLDWPNFLSRNDAGKVTSITIRGPDKDPISLSVELTAEPWANNEVYLEVGDWDAEHVEELLKKSLIWIKSEGSDLTKKNLEPDPFFGSGQLTWRFERIGRFCSNIVLMAHATNAKLLGLAVEILAEMQKLELPYSIKYCSVMVAAGEISAEDAARNIRNLSSSADAQDKLNAHMAVLVWAATYQKGKFCAPPKDLVSELAVLIRSRRSPDLGWALDIAKIFVKKFPQLVEDHFIEDVLIGLNYLAAETHPKSPKTEALSQKSELSELRVSALKLLAELPSSEQREAAVARWLDQIEEESDTRVKKAMNTLRIA